MSNGDIVEIYILASGSKGNMTYLKVGDIRIFVDAGISYQKIKNKMDAYGEDISQVKTLLLTHEHHDHIAGLKTLLKQSHIESIYVSKGTYQALHSEIKDLMKDRICWIQSDQIYQIDVLRIQTIMLSHDAKEPIGFVFFHNEKKYVHLTDTGYVDFTYDALLANADVYLLEANHDPMKLMHSARPFLLRKRIMGELGHLSNQDAAVLMNRYMGRKPTIWVVAHISEDCNSVLDIEEAIVANLDDPTLIEVFYASQESLPVIKI